MFAHDSFVNQPLDCAIECHQQPIDLPVRKDLPSIDMVQQRPLMENNDDSIIHRQSSSPEILPDDESDESNDVIITLTAVHLFDLTIRNQSITNTADTEGRSGRNVSSTHLEDNDMIQQYPSTYDDNSVQHQSSIGTLEGYVYIESKDGNMIQDGDEEGSLVDFEIDLIDLSPDSEIPCFPTPSGRGRKRNIVISTRSSSKRAKTTTNNRINKRQYCQSCGAPQKGHKKDNICPAKFEKPNDRNARILEILERQSWRDRVIPKEDEVQTRDDNEVPPFYYRVRWSVKGERELVPHGKLLDYCTEETLNLFSRRFCKDCGLEPGTNPETGHSCPAEIRHQTPTKRTGSEPYIEKLVERHYWPDCADRKGEESSFFKVEWSTSQPGQREYLPFSWIKKKQLYEHKKDLIFYFGKNHRL